MTLNDLEMSDYAGTDHTHMSMDPLQDFPNDLKINDCGKSNDELDVAHFYRGVKCTHSERDFLLQNFNGRDPSELDVKTTLNNYRAGMYKTSTVTEPKTLSIEATLAQRGKRYGDFTDHARICQDLKDVMVNSRTNPTGNCPLAGWELLDPVKKQALEVIADKIARILSGDPNYDDNWIDIQGYAKLVQDRLPKETK